MTTKQAIQNTLTEIKRVEIAKKRMASLLDQVDRAQNELTALAIILDKEYKDIEKLEKAGLRSIFTKILGNKETQLETERQEYLQAVLHYQERKRTIDLMLKEQVLLMEKINMEDELKKELSQLINKRSQELKLNNPQAKREIEAIRLDIDRQFSLMREIHEALIVGAKVSQMLGKMSNYLKKAVEWGIALEQEAIFGDNPIHRQQRKRSIDLAHQIAFEIKLALNLYEQELLDVYNQQQISVHFNLNQFDQFIEEHFDNLITDWVIQKRIYHALNYTNSFTDRITKVQRSLKAGLIRAEQSISYLEKKQEKLVLEFS